jgi:glycosyltransferase involved in cell wall biosynthesis
VTLPLSVILCTLNRAELLQEALLSLIGQDFPQSDYEIVVVDNGSTDRTAEAVRELQDRAPIRYVREERMGLCIARNTGWQAARGRIIAFFDDDARARPGWLAAIRDAFGRNPGIGVVGGRVDPIWQGVRPPWLADAISGSLTILDWGPSEKIIKDIRCTWLAGANMAVPKALLTEIGGFHPWLDRAGKNLLSSGDVFLQKELMRRGYQCLYVPTIAIEHLVPSSRLGQDWFLRRFYWQGVSDAVMQLIEQSPSLAKRMRMASARGGQLMRSRNRLKALMSSPTNPDVFALKCFALLDIGFIVGLLGAARR